MFILGYIYHIGIDVKKDIEKAIYYYKLASSLNFEYAKNNLAVIYNNINDENDKNIWISIEYLKEAINQKQDELALYNLARIYLCKNPIKNSIDEAINLLISSDKFLPSIELLCYALLIKFDFDMVKIERELHNTVYKNKSNHILKIIKKHKLFDKSSLMKRFSLLKVIDIIYDYRLSPDFALEDEIQDKSYQSELKNITAEFYDGFGIKI